MINPRLFEMNAWTSGGAFETCHTYKIEESGDAVEEEQGDGLYRPKKITTSKSADGTHCPSMDQEKVFGYVRHEREIKNKVATYHMSIYCTTNPRIGYLHYLNKLMGPKGWQPADLWEVTQTLA